MVEQTAAASTVLREQVGELQHAVSRFTLEATDATTSVAPRRPLLVAAPRQPLAA
jgi:hypothetical protein